MDPKSKAMLQDGTTMNSLPSCDKYTQIMPHSDDKYNIIWHIYKYKYNSCDKYKQIKPHSDDKYNMI